MIKTNIYFLFLTIIVLFTTSCVDKDLNNDPESLLAKDLVPKNVLPQAEVYLAFMYNEDVSRLNALFTQHIAGSARQHQTYGRNSFANTNSDALFATTYVILGSDMNFIIDQYGEKNPHYKGIATVLKAFMLLVCTDLIGDIPYTEAWKTDISSPKYDGQEAVYTAIHGLLDQAITDLGNGTNDVTPGSDDLFYGGDAEKWIKLVHMIKARMYLQTTGRAEGNYQKALDELALGFTSSEDDFKLKFGTVQANSSPWFQWVQGRDDTRAGKYLVDLLLDNGNGVKDPRISYFITKNPDEDAATVPYKGSKYGTDASTHTSNTGPFFATADATSYILTYAEAKFIEAECLLALEDKPGAATSLNDAIKESMALVVPDVEADSVSSYINANTYTLSNVTLENLMMHKYIGMCGNYITYNDWRRTNLPVLSPVPGYLNGVEFVYSWPFPQKETQLNANVPDIDNITKVKSKVWWDVN